MELARGANTVIEGTSLKVAVNGSAPGTVDLMVFQLDERNEVRDDADFVFFNQPVSPEGAVRLESGGVIEIDIARLPADIHQLSVAWHLMRRQTEPCLLSGALVSWWSRLVPPPSWLRLWG